ncbi:MAG TPA: hypothetical protein VF534_01595 [Paraburkholderia sp.]
MQAHIDGTRRQLGELGAMAQQTEAMERRILSIATQKLDQLQGQLESARVAAMTGDDDAKSKYADLVTERGRLQQVIANARAVLGNA